jgi:NitT/TauT family transport system substrate-binding protein
MINKRSINKSWIAGVAATGLLLVGCGTTQAPSHQTPASATAPGASPAASSSTLTTVHVGLGGTQGEAGVYLALAQGYFEQEGIKVEISKTELVQLPELLAGQVDLVATPLSPGVLNAAARNIGLKIIVPMARSDPGASGLFLVVRKALIDNGKVKTYADLSGLKIAIPNDQLKYVIAKAMEAGGRTLSDANFVTLDFQSMVTSFGNGAIDAGMLPEPLATAASEKGLAVKWRSVGEIVPGEQQTVVVASAQFAANRDLAARWVTAYLRGVRDYNDAFFKNQRRQEVTNLLAKALPVADPVLYDKMAYTHLDPDGKIDVASLDDQMHWFVTVGLLSAPVNVSSLVDASLAQQAVAKLGAYK